MNKPLTQNEIALANITFAQRNTIIALAAIVASLPKDLISREAVQKNVESSPLFGEVARNKPEVRAEVEKLARLILGE